MHMNSNLCVHYLAIKGNATNNLLQLINIKVNIVSYFE